MIRAQAGARREREDEARRRRAEADWRRRFLND